MSHPDDLTQEQIEELREAFALFDQDGNGHISSSDLLTVMRRLRQEVSEAEIKQMISQVDIDEKNPVSYTKYVTLLLLIRHHDNTRESLSAMFNTCDESRTGLVSADAIHHLLGMLGYHVTVQEVKDMMKAFDTTKRGQLNKDEFVKMMQARFSLTVPHDFESLTTAQHRDLYTGFHLMDRYKKGVILVESAKVIFTALGHVFDQDTYDTALEQVHTDDGFLDYDTFLRLLDVCMKKQAEDLEMVAMFKAFDTDNNGYIDSNELQTTMASLGMDLTDEDVRQMMSEIGAENSGRIYYKDFVRLMKEKIDKAKQMISSVDDVSSLLTKDSVSGGGDVDLEELRQAFSFFDKNNDGHIESSEVMTVMASIGMHMDEQEVRKMINRADKDGNGMIEFEEFCDLMKKHGRRLTDIDHRVSTKHGLRPVPGSPSAFPRQSVDALPKPTRDLLRELFKDLDDKHDGVVSVKSLKSKINKMSTSLSDKEWKALLKETGLDSCKKLKFNDFHKLICSEFQNTECILTQTKLTKAQIRALRLLFGLCDKKNTGKLNQRSVYNIVATLWLPANAISQGFPVVDSDGDGKIDFKQMVHLLEKYVLRQKSATPCHNAAVTGLSAADLQVMFAAFDKDKNGYIDASELKHTMKELGLPLSEEDVNHMLKEAGGHGRIYYEDFVDFMTSNIGQKTNQSLLSTPESSYSRGSGSSLTSGDLMNTANLQVAFSLFDKNQDGYISCGEVEDVMRSIGVKVNHEKVKKMFDRADRDGNGLIDFDEFNTLMVQYQRRRTASGASNASSTSQEEDIKRVYEIFDRDGDGFISEEEIRLTMKGVGVVLTDDDVKAMMLQAGAAPGGKIGYAEFCSIMQGQFKPLRTSKDPVDGGGNKKFPASPAASRTSATKNDRLPDRHDVPEIVLTGCNLEVKECAHSKRNAQQKDGGSSATDGQDAGGRPSDGHFGDPCQRCGDVDRLATHQKLCGTCSLPNGQTGKPDCDTSTEGATAPSSPSRFSASGGGGGAEGGGCQGGAETGCVKTTGRTDGVSLAPHQPLKRSHSEPVKSATSSKSRQPTDTWKAFKVFDRDSSGYIDCEELRLTLEELGVPLSDEDLLHLMHIADMNGDGKIDYREFCRLMTGALCGYQKLAAELQDRREGQIRAPLYLGNGMVDFHEFLRMMSRTRSKVGDGGSLHQVEEAEMRQAFKVFDIDGNGLIDANELRQTMKNLGENLSDQDVKAMIRAADRNGDGKIDYEEFIRMMYNK